MRLKTLSYTVVNPGEQEYERASYSASLGDRQASDYAHQNARRYGGTVYARDTAGELHFVHSYQESRTIRV